MTLHLLNSLPGPVALVLGSGGLNAAAQAGMLGPLAGWQPDIIVGASGGALTASCLATAGDVAAGAVLSAEAWRQVADSKLVQIGWTTMAGAVTGRENGRRTKAWRALFESLFNAAELADDDTQALVATNLSTGQPHLFTHGPIVPALMAAAAFPAVASAVELDDEVLVDGSFTASLPVLQAVGLGARSVVALDTGRAQIAGESTAPKRWYDVVMASVRHQVAANAAHDVATAAAHLPIVILSTADPFRVMWHDIPDRIAAGETAGRDQLAALKSRWTSIHEPGVYTAADEVRLDRRLTGVVR